MLKKAIILGGERGMLGQALKNILLASGYSVMVLDREIADSFDLLTGAVKEFQPDWLYNTIAYTQVDNAEDESEAAYRINADLAENIGRLALDNKIGLVHYSTDFVFNGSKDHAYLEDDAADPQSVYGASKLSGEKKLLKLGLEKLCIIRTAWLFGPYRPNFVLTILRKGKEKGELQVVNDQTGCPTYTIDLAHYSIDLVNSGGTGLFHVVNGGQATWFELAAQAVELAGVSCTVLPVESSAYPQKAKRPTYSVLDSGKFQRLTGVKPRFWREALRDYIISLNGQF